MSVVRINEFQAAEGKADELYGFLKSLRPFITSSNGCLSCDVLRGYDDTGIFVVIEKWQSTEAHAASIKNFPKESMEAAMPLFGGPPKGRFFSE